MEKILQKTAEKIKKINHISGKDLALGYILPLLRTMHSINLEAFKTVDGHFDTVFESLKMGEQGFIEDALAFVSGYNSFVDRLMFAAGFFEEDPEKEGAFRIANTMPAELQEEMKSQQRQMVSFLQQLEAMRALEPNEDFDDEEAEEAEEDEDDDAFYGKNSAGKVVRIDPEVYDSAMQKLCDEKGQDPEEEVKGFMPVPLAQSEETSEGVLAESDLPPPSSDGPPATPEETTHA